MAERGVRSWEERPWASARSEVQEIEANTLQILEMLFSKPWMPREGTALEIGCGTAPILRWLYRQGFVGYGVDISKTAIEMARAQSADFPIHFVCADFCEAPASIAELDLIIDGHCLHCITDAHDRKRFLNKTRQQLKKEGVFIVLTMCGPVNMKVFHEQYPDQLLRNNVIYHPVSETTGIDGIMDFDGKTWLPTRYVGHCMELLKDLHRAGFEPLHVTYDANADTEAVGSLAVACRRRAALPASEEAL